MSKQLSFCFVTPEYALEPPFGGIATHDRTMAQWLVSKGHSVHVVCSSRTRKPGVVKDGDVQVHYVPPQRIKPRRVLAYLARIPGLGQIKEAYFGWNTLEDSLGVWRAIGRLERETSFDVIQCADFGGLAFWGVWPTKRHRFLLLRGHGIISMVPAWLNAPGGRFSHLLEGIYARRADYVLTVSRYLANQYREQHNIREDRLGYLLQPYDVGDLVKAEDAQPKDNENPVILYVGRLEPEYKGSDVLLEALQLVHQRLPHVQARLIGKVLPHFELRLRSCLQGNESWLRYDGSCNQQEVFEQMLHSDLLVLPSRNETAGRVLVEAQYCGLPQIASRVGGIPELVEDGVTGLLVEPGNPQALAEAIQRLCNAPDLRVEMGRQSRLIAQARADVDSTMNTYLRFIRALVGGGDPRSLLLQATSRTDHE